MQLPTELLRTFVHVVESGSFTRAAQSVNRTQSAVSQQMRRLEEELGQELFLRQGRDVLVSPGGHALLPYARRILKLHDEAVQALVRPELTGLVRFGLPDDFAARFLPGILSQFSAAFPRMQVEVRCEPSSCLLPALEASELDLAVVGCLHPGLPHRLICREQLVWASSPVHTPQEEDPLPLAVFQEGCAHRLHATRALESAGRSYRIAYTSASISGIQAAVVAGLAVAPIGAHSVTREMCTLGVREGLPPLASEPVLLALKRGPLNEPEERLAAMVTEEFRGHGACPL